MAKAKSGKVLKMALVGTGVLVAGGGGAIVVASSAYTPLVSPGTTVAGVPLGGLTKKEATDRLETWWAEASARELSLTADGFKNPPKGFTLKSLGVRLDGEATMKSLPVEDFWANSSRKLSGQKVKSASFEPKVQVGKEAVEEIARYVEANRPDMAPAKVDFVKGEIVKSKEEAGYAVDERLLPTALAAAGLKGETVALPLKKAAQKVPDEALDGITDVVSTYTSHYSEGNTNRASNIRNAARRLSGTILMPGEKFSFNGVLGRRTAKNGFKLAGVYNNGKHDVDIGGGICQVSGTLYNAVLLADLKIVNRSNHTFPVPYLPVGRDATVSFPAPDFSFANSTDGPIAISASAGGGTITFRVLGKKVDGQEVSLYTAGHQSWGRAEKVIVDTSLAPGRRVVEEPGGSGHRIQTYRIVKLNGVEVKREHLGQSEYPGGTRIVRVNPKAAAPKPVKPAPGDAGADAPPTAPPAGGGTGDPAGTSGEG
ncbi:MAG: VanW family protein [Armatimonadetes bacterium]|nr:VanW family protein [Armatimonadota bacterium]